MYLFALTLIVMLIFTSYNHALTYTRTHANTYTHTHTLIIPHPFTPFIHPIPSKHSPPPTTT